MVLPWHSSLGQGHGHLPWQPHVDLTMAIPWYCRGTPHWVKAMGIFHGNLMWTSPWPSHGIAVALLTGSRPWASSMATSCGPHHGHPMVLPWPSSLGQGHGHLPWQPHVDLTMAIPWYCRGPPHWVKAMGIFHGNLMWTSPW